MQSILSSVIGPSGPVIANLVGKNVIVSGGALGIGYEISRHFAMMGAHVIMVNRKEEQGDEAIEKITEEFVKKHGKNPSIEWKGCDMGSLKEVREVAKGLNEKLDRLDLLVLSHGINANKFGLDADGIDRHFGVNALGGYYMINQLYPLLRKTSQLPDSPKGSVRIVVESSELHRMSPSSQDGTSRNRGIHFGSEDEITEGAKEMGPMELYGRTKLALILYMKALKEKVIEKQGDDIYAISVHPGTVNTDAQDQWTEAYPAPVGQAVKAMSIATSRNTEQGSYSAIYAALSDEIVTNKWNGVYLNDPATLGKESTQACDKNLVTSLWELSERMVKRIVGEDALKPWDQSGK